MSEIDNILKIKQTGLKLAKGNLLVATPLLYDFYFGKSVIILTEHSEEGSVGLILNKKANKQVKELVPSFNDIDLPLFLGGPVNQDQLFFIHNNSFVEETFSIGNGLFWGGNLQQVIDFINDGIISKDNIKFFLGYSGWSSMQLQNEINTNSWVITKPDNIYNILQNSDNSLWKSIVASLGKEYKKWFVFPTNPIDN